MEFDNPVIENIYSRRSVRDYLAKPLCEGTIEKIINAGIQAPTGMGLQPWRFVVVRNKNMMKRMSDYSKPFMVKALEESDDERAVAVRDMFGSEHFNIFYGAPILVLVLGLKDDAMSDYDCSMCAGSMMLTAHSMGIGSCWIGSSAFVEQDPGIMKELGVPEGYKIVAPLIFGYPRTTPDAPERNEPVISWVD